MFNWFKNRFKTENNEPEIEIKRDILENGIKFSINKIEKEFIEKLSFPIVYSKYFDLHNLINKDFYLSLQVLEELWYSEQLRKTTENNYILNLENIYEYEQELKELLGLKSDEKLDISIEEEAPIGTSNFSLKYNIHHPEKGYISSFYDRIGPFYPLNDSKAILLNKELYNFLELIDNPPLKRDEQFKYFAKVKTKAKNLDISLSEYLENEDYYFPENIDVEIEEESLDHIQLKPEFEELDQTLNKEAKEIIKEDQNYGVKHERNKNRRIFFDKDTKKDYTQIIKNKNLTGEEVPKLINNPASYLPDSIDLDKFSKRVKGLKERIYQPKPYVHAEDSDQINWFDLDIGVNLETETEENNRKEEIDFNKFKKIVRKAKKEDKEYVLWKDKWIKVPDNSQELIRSYEKAEELKENGKVKNTKIPYIFDIYENIDRLEYNLKMINLRQELQKADAFTYRTPELFRGELRDYQKDGYVWLNRLKLESLGGLLADDMGLGKTVQVIALMAKLKNNNKLTPSLVVAKKSLLENWKKEIQKFCPDIQKKYIHLGNRIKNSDLIKKSEIVLTTYSTLVSDQVLLGEIDWKLLICDEVQAIRNHSTLRAHAVKAQKARMRLGLSGTPVQNSLTDLWSIYDYIQPGLLNSYTQFKNQFVKPLENSSGKDDYKEYELKLKKKIFPVYKRRTKDKELKEELPEKIEKIKKIQMSDYQYNMYMNIIKNEQQSEGRTHLKSLQQLIQVSSHPELINKNWQHKSIETLLKEGPKLKTTLEILKKVKDNSEKAIIFTTYRIMQYILSKIIRVQFKINLIPIINGNSYNRLSVVDNFNARDGFNVMILSPKAAGTGLNITGANHVLHYTRWWNPAVEQQATDRVYRIGQDKNVYVYYPIVTAEGMETVEEKLARLLQEKKKLSKNIIVPNKKLENEIKENIQQTFAS